MFFGKPILAFDVIYNRETSQNEAYYYTDSASLRELMLQDDLDGTNTTETARHEYIWETIARQYEALY